MRPFHKQVLAALQNFGDKMGEVQVSYDDLARQMGGAVSADQVHLALIDLKNDGQLPGTPTITSDTFIGRIPEGGRAFRKSLIKALRSREDSMGRVTGTYADIAQQMGGGATPQDVHLGIIQLKDDGYFLSRPTLTTDFFECRLPEHA